MGRLLLEMFDIVVEGLGVRCLETLWSQKGVAKTSHATLD